MSRIWILPHHSKTGLKKKETKINNNLTMLEQLKKYEVISFALEGVLDDELDGSPNPSKKEMQDLCKELSKAGKKIIIYTKRYERSDSKHLTPANKKEYKPGYDLAAKLGVYDIIFTNRNAFYHYMNNDNKQVHINCSGYETVLLAKYKPGITTININKEIWQQPS